MTGCYTSFRFKAIFAHIHYGVQQSKNIWKLDLLPKLRIVIVCTTVENAQDIVEKLSHRANRRLQTLGIGLSHFCSLGFVLGDSLSTLPCGFS